MPWLASSLAVAVRFPPRALPWAARIAADQVRFTLVDGLPVVVLLAYGMGVAVGMEVVRFASWLGLGETLGLVLTLVVVRHFGPLLAAILVVGRSGTAIVTEMATAQLTGEVAALRALGIAPLHYYVVPRIVGGAVSMAAIMVVFDFAALLGAWTAVSTREGLSPGIFLESLLRDVGAGDVAFTLLKGVVFGVGMVVLCVQAGLGARGGPTQIPIAARQGVVRALLFVFAASVAFALLTAGE